MSYNRLYANSFRYGLLFGKDIRPGDPVSVSVVSVDDMVLAVRKAYIDMSPRTLKSNDSENKQGLDPQKKAELFTALAEKIVAYMQHGTEDFEQWHHNVCTFFIEKFANILQQADKNPADATYGKAQKILNMTFKYAYCFDDAEAYAARFVPCHMALDSYILNWVKDWYLDEYNQGKGRGEKLSRSGARQLPKWSSLKYKAEAGDVPQYIEIQTAICAKVAREFHKPPLEAEFDIWYTQRQLARENGDD